MRLTLGGACRELGVADRGTVQPARSGALPLAWPLLPFCLGAAGVQEQTEGSSEGSGAGAGQSIISLWLVWRTRCACLSPGQCRGKPGHEAKVERLFTRGSRRTAFP